MKPQMGASRSGGAVAHIAQDVDDDDLSRIARAQRQADPIFAGYCNATMPLQN
jgi:hypothetical protein